MVYSVCRLDVVYRLLYVRRKYLMLDLFVKSQCGDGLSFFVDK